MEVDSGRPTERQLHDRRVVELHLIESNVLLQQIGNEVRGQSQNQSECNNGNLNN